jgi:hypothetical protein
MDSEGEAPPVIFFSAVLMGGKESLLASQQHLYASEIVIGCVVLRSRRL